MIRVEFHCHTEYSKDSLTHPADLLRTCRYKGIDRVVVTDHNSIAGALIAKKLDPGRVIIGEEIMTTKGELLAAYVKEGIPAGLSPLESIERLRAQGAFISVSHPFDTMRSGHWKLSDLLDIAPLIDAIEIFNARCIWPGFNRRARSFARQHLLPGTVGSDAHAAFELGKASMFLPPFHNADGLRQVITQARPQCSLSAPWVHFTSRYAVWKKQQSQKEPMN